MNVESKWLEDFLVLAKVRNFSQAAALRNVTQPAFSRRIRLLEDTVGAELIDRKSKPIELTPSGKLFRITARTLINQMMTGISQISDLSRLGGNVVQMAAAHSLATSLIPEIQNALPESGYKPILSVEAIDVDQAIKELREGACDILLAFDDEVLRLPPYQSQLLSKTELLPVSACNEQGIAIFSFDSSEPVPWLAYSSTSYMGRQVETVREQVQLNPIFSSSMTDMLKQLVLNCKGVAWLPAYSITQELKQKKVAIIGNQSLRLPIEYYAYRYQARLHPAGEKVWSILCDIEF
ncbi:LysR family transcriptional regulator [Aliivibrio logei]|jgi:DNA-binding transcriptional LysR family regulator|uniref:LysR family transcriptional regulator n=1 Tax=Aliivibrio logei TaxID=688 RepID=UPI0035C93C3C